MLCFRRDRRTAFGNSVVEKYRQRKHLASFAFLGLSSSASPFLLAFFFLFRSEDCFDSKLTHSKCFIFEFGTYGFRTAETASPTIVTSTTMKFPIKRSHFFPVRVRLLVTSLYGVELERDDGKCGSYRYFKTRDPVRITPMPSPDRVPLVLLH